MTPADRLAQLGLTIPEPPGAVGAYVPWQRMGSIVTTSFQLPWVNGELAYVGRLGAEITTEQGYEAARICALNGIAQLLDASGDLALVRVARLEGHVGCVEGFAELPQVLNGASELIGAVFGEAGRHARTAEGHATMPLNVPVMVGFWAELVDA